MVDTINIEKPNNFFILPFLFFIFYLNIHLLQMKLKPRNQESISHTWQNYVAYFKGLIFAEIRFSQYQYFVRTNF